LPVVGRQVLGEAAKETKRQFTDRGRQKWVDRIIWEVCERQGAGEEELRGGESAEERVGGEGGSGIKIESGRGSNICKDRTAGGSVCDSGDPGSSEVGEGWGKIIEISNVPF
jgi:hypothetical protein